MHLFWESFIDPLLEATGPKHHIVEIGSSSGVNTKNILSYCKKSDSKCTVIDPLEIGNIDDIRNDLKVYGTQIKGLSLDVLESTSPGSSYLIDGDHNYYTVINECRAILAIAQKNRGKFPIVFFHDVDWPYARRDLYYNKSTIPQNEAQPSGTGGLFPGVREQVKNEGLNAGQDNALVEGGPKNGVLTGIEDFITENRTTYQFVFFKLPSFHGLGVLIDKKNYDEKTLEKIKHIIMPEARITAYLRELESFRIQDLTMLLTEKTKLVNMYGALYQELVAERTQHEALKRKGIKQQIFSKMKLALKNTFAKRVSLKEPS